ncbi:Hypothetical protein KNT65_gp294 [Escherichia phage EcS1]|uniref:Uncharacterized protein n=1 Tax=Escherichia phage EcS1 TaxID=2083276 RepID=A0A2Z5ZC45_9CAUD|nr:Hypothetical protein KNT65_gp294 [Escherichia phage EcS1]BBC78199.1 Hypothetical protein [Escherichia phage EcS1]
MINLYKHPDMNVRYLVDTDSLRVLIYYHDSALTITSLDPIVRRNLVLLEENCQVEPALHFDEYFEMNWFCQVDM